jgi:HK97 gp10 family phage protein
MTVKWNGAAIVASVRAATLTGIVRGTEAVREEATSLMLNSPRSGRIYQRRGVVHKSSGPGEPPAPDTGNLIRNIQTSVDPQTLSGNVNFGTQYSRHLEYGTIKMAPRPFARPAAEHKRAEIQADIAQEIAGALK